MKIVFAGSPEFSVTVLNRLIESGNTPEAVITQPDKPKGRKRLLSPTPVKECAQKHGIPVYDFVKIREHVDEVKKIGADIMITCAYGQILTKDILQCFKGGVWNLHASLLPEYRGASPIQSAILGGKTHTGITVMRTEEALDSGDILLVKRLEIGESDYGELQERLSLLAAEAALNAIEILKEGNVQLLMQDEAKATFCKKISKADAKINFSESAEKVVRLIRATCPQPSAYCNLNGVLLNIYKVSLACGNFSGSAGEVVKLDKKANAIIVKCGEGAIAIHSLQPAGGKIINAGDFINGRKISEGDKLD